MHRDIPGARASWVVLAAGFFLAGHVNAECVAAFQRGDSNRDNKVDLSDAIFTLGYLFLGNEEPGCQDAADADDSGRINLTDPVFTVSHLFQGGIPIPPPNLGECSLDPTQDDLLSCAEYSPCALAGGDACTSNDCCEPGEYCEKNADDCDGIGTCSTRPDFCPLFFDPVCGCDGVTYGNRCEAAAAGVNVLRFGPCEVNAECDGDEDCAEESFCFRKEGVCDGPGICLPDPTPEECGAQPDEPVCGCDDTTYRNSCEANLAGVNVAYTGACDGIPRCSSDKECAIDSYCAFPEGFCGGLGKCSVRPTECPEDVFDPVCGCDGITYSNECLAAAAGVSFSFRGKCDGGNFDCKTSAFCGGGLFCKKADGDCDGIGRCENVPASCDDVFDPVCGCDGITYQNECQAHAAGVNVLGKGACPQ